MNCIAVITTVATRAQAQALARALVERKLAACAQISEIESFYTWNDTVVHEPEFRLLFKTVAERYPALEAAIREHHGYELPAIHAIALEPVFALYAQWIADNSSGS
jgi:periplasmic divalent cation tolerance protein